MSLITILVIRRMISVPPRIVKERKRERIYKIVCEDAKRYCLAEVVEFFRTGGEHERRDLGIEQSTDACKVAIIP